jgi:hypothetical protein
VKTGSRFRIMATLRNLVIGLIRQAGYTKIAATIRKIKTDPRLLLRILGLPQHPTTTPRRPRWLIRVHAARAGSRRERWLVRRGSRG